MSPDPQTRNISVSNFFEFIAYKKSICFKARNLLFYAFLDFSNNGNAYDWSTQHCQSKSCGLVHSHFIACSTDFVYLTAKYKLIEFKVLEIDVKSGYFSLCNLIRRYTFAFFLWKLNDMKTLLSKAVMVS